MHSIVQAALATAMAPAGWRRAGPGARSMDDRKYREMLADGNPAELFEKGRGSLEEAPRPGKRQPEQCDMGLGPGKLEGAYAQLPRYFADTKR